MFKCTAWNCSDIYVVQKDGKTLAGVSVCYDEKKNGITGELVLQEFVTDITKIVVCMPDGENATCQTFCDCTLKNGRKEDIYVVYDFISEKHICEITN